ncbi:MAG: 23S rRNA (adenine(2503)-C(2))-methyltransferase RlmN [Clostridiales bacterium]|jgi:23S rRNA (adenine2503-C2)-methyltransferase|nr:23S rRNA (adenine(2503)-C(2))-methyltransferase RlmN [Clostridiales bacterium]
MDYFDIGSATYRETSDFIDSLEEPGFRAGQIYGWVHKRHAAGFDKMSDLPKELRKKLSERALFQGAGYCIKKEDNDGTIKYLLEFKNNIIINEEISVETVFMDYRHGGAVCVSTQAGCPMGCVFCVSGSGGFLRNLTAGEMLAQVYTVSRDRGKTITNVTLMGSGEPLLNLDNVLRFIEVINSEHGLNISQRRITLSTCGVTDKIYELLEKKLQITLAVSLHAPDDAVRKSLMPVAAAYPMDGLLKACKEYGDRTKRRVTFEYAMIEGINDAPKQARDLAEKLKHTLAHINLIPVNPGMGKDIRPSKAQVVEAFRDILAERGLAVTIRRSLGSGINAACGQLKHKIMYHNKEQSQ